MPIPPAEFGPTGFIEPTEQDILNGVTADINAAFGGNLNPALNTPQGQLATSITAIVGYVNDTFLYYTTQTDPAYAQGRMQDAIARIYFIERLSAEPTVVQATCTGLVGTVIPVGALAQAADGNLYSCTQAGTIPVGGSITLPFSCNTPGAIACPAHSLTTIYQSILGWDSIDNSADGVIGQDTETRDAFEARRFASVAKNSLGALPSVLGAVLDVPGVLDAYVTENSTGSPVTVGGYTLEAHSLYVAVVGGEAADVADAIWTKKAPGCAMNGNTSVTVYDTSYDLPQPSYTIKFETPAALPILFAVTIVNNALVPADATTQIQNAIIAAFAGEIPPCPRARIASVIYASQYYAAVAALGGWVQIVSIKVGCQNDDDVATATGCAISGTTLTLGSVTGGTWAIGQTVVGVGILPGTVIQSGSGTSWVVNLTQTVGSETMYGVVADKDDVTAQIDQSPNLSAANIAVTAA